MLRGKIRICITEGQILYWFRPVVLPFLQLGLGLFNQPNINETGASGRTSRASPEAGGSSYVANLHDPGGLLTRVDIFTW